MPVTKLSSHPTRIMSWLVSVGFFMQMLNSTIVNTSLPSIAKDLAESPLGMQSVVIAYFITTAALIPASGWLADYFGTRRIFLLAVVLFFLGSLSCALSQDLTMLVCSRVLQGIAGALLLPVGRLIILRAYPREQLIQLLSLITTAALLGSLIGPALGGFIVEYTSWHWIFLVNLPVGIAIFILAWRYMPDTKRGDCSKFDKSGFILFALAMIFISLGLEGVQEAFPLYRIIVLIGAGLICFVAYWTKSLFSAEPLFNPYMFKLPSFAIGIVGNFMSRLGSGTMPFLVPLLLQIGMDYSPAQTGLMMIPLSLGAIFTKFFTPPLVRKLGYKKMLATSTFGLGLFICAFSLLGINSPIPLVFGLFLIMGTLYSMQLTAINTLTLAALSDKDTAGGNSLLSASLQLAVGFGVSVAATLLQNFEGMFGLEQAGVIKAFRYTFICIGGLTLLSAIPFLLLKSSYGKEASPK